MRPSTSSSTSSSSSLLLAHPTPSKPTYIRCGIGGAGNWHKASSIPPSTTTPGFSPAICVTSPHAPLLPHAAPASPTLPTHFKSGIGGAGNIHAASARSVIDFEEELARHRAVERNAPAAFHVGIGGAGNSRCRKTKGGDGQRLPSLRSRKSTGVLELRGEGTSAFGMEDVAGPSLPPVRKVEFGDENVEEFEVEHGGYAYYSNEPLPYGALDILRRRLEQTFLRGREVPATPTGKRRGLHAVGAEGQERRFLRSHRSVWRF